MKTFLLILFLSSIAVAATPPQQPKSGPGGSNYAYGSFVKKSYGQAEKQYWIYTPASPDPLSAPVIVFNHGWGAMFPGPYVAWIEHMVRNGNIVIYPRYQSQWAYPPSQITTNALVAVKDAMDRLEQNGPVRPDLESFAVVGHSAGGMVTANFGVLATAFGLPQPRAIMSVEPAKSWNLVQQIRIPLEDLSQVPANTLLLTVTGDRDFTAWERDAKRIFRESTKIPLSNKDFVRVNSDFHGSPNLIANHYAPCSTTVNALDFYAYWKLFDALTDAAF
jgi:pimeloyl-ACP methyl ester carboxylesterase